MNNGNWPMTRLLWCALLAMNVAGCATTSDGTLPPAPGPQVQLPALPAEALPDPLPAWCLEMSATTCSTRLLKFFESWRLRLTHPSPSTAPALPSTPPPANG